MGGGRLNTYPAQILGQYQHVVRAFRNTVHKIRVAYIPQVDKANPVDPIA